MSGKDEHIELVQGTLDLIVLRSLSTMGALHAYALAQRLAQVSDHPLSLNQGTLYPALVRLEQKGWIKGAWAFRMFSRTGSIASTSSGSESSRSRS
jgi:PadR family transcriptional regulator, regulatory protein PadR